jgi:uncharacterized protein YdiU (UPF0061 family)
MASPDLPLTAAPPAAAPPRFPFDNTHARLPEHFYARQQPTPVAAPRLIKINTDLARDLGLDPAFLATPAGVAILSGNRIGDGSEPLAQAYAGHQFGHFVPQLGDGRANLLGELVSPTGLRYDIQLKGSGPTPFSHRGDGRAAIGPVLREYILSEAMAALGVPTTRALAAVATGERVFRETPLPGAVFTRIAASHLRVGTIQYFAARHDTQALGTLAAYALARHYPHADPAQPAHALLQGVVARQARLIAQWMNLGFIHGVMNTDNTSISGETIDYGPCAFMEAYDPAQVYSSIDHAGRYAYSNQPPVALWNLARLAEALLPVLAEEAGSEPAAVAAANQILSTFEPQYLEAHTAGLLQKIGLAAQPQAGPAQAQADAALAEDLLQRMAAHRADFTLTFRRLCAAAALPQSAAAPQATAAVRTLFADPASYDEWETQWRRRLAAEPTDPHARAASMRRVNPAYIPRNHLVEEVIQAATLRDDFHPFEDLLAVVTRPYEERPGQQKYSIPARPDECVLQTFCGT